MKIIQLPEKSQEIVSQLSGEWRNVDIEHFGREINEWKTENFFLYAKENSKVLGFICFEIEMEVCYIKEIIVAVKYRKKGIGKELVEKAEEIAKQHGAHISYLTTGVDWNERKFYETLGYVKTADLKNHYLGKDFIHLTKNLK